MMTPNGVSSSGCKSFPAGSFGAIVSSFQDVKADGDKHVTEGPPGEVSPMTDTVFDRLQALLRASDIQYEVLRHAPVYTSEEAAAVRGTTLASGAKALICRADDRFSMFVIPADRRLASKHVRRAAGIRSFRFATIVEVHELTGLAPGSIPPFGSLFELPTCCDERLAACDRINFNAGDHTISISLAFTDYLRVEKPQMAKLAE